MTWWTTERQNYAVDYLKQNANLSDVGARGLVARWMHVEAPDGPGDVNRFSGASGIGQWLGDRKKGYTLGDFDSQLEHAVRELNGPERRAGNALRAAQTEAQAAIGASIFERAEGYNANTGRDNFTATAQAKIASIGGGSPDVTTALDTAFPDYVLPASMRAWTAADYFGGATPVAYAGGDTADDMLGGTTRPTAEGYVQPFSPGGRGPTFGVGIPPQSFPDLPTAYGAGVPGGPAPFVSMFAGAGLPVPSVVPSGSPLSSDVHAMYFAPPEQAMFHGAPIGGELSGVVPLQAYQTQPISYNPLPSYPVQPYSTQPPAPSQPVPFAGYLSASQGFHTGTGPENAPPATPAMGAAAASGMQGYTPPPAPALPVAPSDQLYYGQSLQGVPGEMSQMPAAPAPDVAGSGGSIGHVLGGIVKAAAPYVHQAVETIRTGVMPNGQSLGGFLSGIKGFGGGPLPSGVTDKSGFSSFMNAQQWQGPGTGHGSFSQISGGPTYQYFAPSSPGGIGGYAVPAGHPNAGTVYTYPTDPDIYHSVAS